jgi:hypothetical protein
MATSYNGWPASSSPSAIGINSRWEPIPGHKFPAGIKSGDVEVVFTYLVRQLNARVEAIREYAPGDEWGYFYKYSANSPTKLSCHASGTAIDYNATQHPNGKRGTWTAAQVRTIRAIMVECSGVIYWGGDRNTPDEMHFEIQGSMAQVKAAAAKIRAIGTTPPAPVPAPKPEEADLVYRIVWFRGEPTAAGTQGAVTAAYRCTYAKREKTQDKDPYMCVEGWWIANQTELKVWRDKGLLEANKVDTPAAIRQSIDMHGGPFHGIGVG